MPGDPEFRMVVADIFFIRGRGTVVTGIISQGSVSVGDSFTIYSTDKSIETTAVGIEIFRRHVKTAGTGQRVGLVLPDITKDAVSRGDVLAGSDYQHEDVWWES
ncbi:MAG: EF-Tu/IF-2/RF-3 family GTPase [Anaerolineae bacterium]|nr:EF-Tu/IF-2/RF-3 family GTPase [Anaerolineae bacterium]